MCISDCACRNIQCVLTILGFKTGRENYVVKGGPSASCSWMIGGDPAKVAKNRERLRMPCWINKRPQGLELLWAQCGSKADNWQEENPRGVERGKDVDLWWEGGTEGVYRVVDLEPTAKRVYAEFTTHLPSRSYKLVSPRLNITGHAVDWIN